MDWVKRNLSFVIGGVVALALLLFSGLYLYSNSKKNNDARDQLAAEYNELKRLHGLKPHPGKGGVDNIRLAREQKEELLQVMQEVRAQFEPIPALPSAERVTSEQFSASLRRTIEELSRQSAASSVVVPADYSFSFEAEKRLVRFAPGSLNRLAVQLGEVKVISQILFAAKINKLTSLRRERVSPDDLTGPQSDYLPGKSQSNELAVISSYEFSFESFTPELADVISGFANSPHGLVIMGMNVRPAKPPAAPGARGGYGDLGGYGAAGATPIYAAPPVQSQYQAAEGYGGGGGYGAVAGGYGAAGGGSTIRRPTFTRPTFGGGAGGGAPYEAQPTAEAQPQYQTAYPVAGASSGTAQTLIDEQPLSVTMAVDVIKLLPPEKE